MLWGVYLKWAYKGNLKLMTLGSERVKQLTQCYLFFPKDRSPTTITIDVKGTKVQSICLCPFCYAQCPISLCDFKFCYVFAFLFMPYWPKTAMLSWQEMYELLAILDFNNERKRMSVSNWCILLSVVVVVVTLIIVMATTISIFIHASLSSTVIKHHPLRQQYDHRHMFCCQGWFSPAT